MSKWWMAKIMCECGQFNYICIYWRWLEFFVSIYIKGYALGDLGDFN